MNITTGWENVPQAVLIRGVIPADPESEERMMKLRMNAVRRQLEKKQALPMQSDNALVVKKQTDIDTVLKRREKAIRKNLADGPGKLCIAMEVSKADNDVDMVESSTFYVTEGIEIKPEDIKAGKRIGIDYAEEAADYLWRFYL